MRTSEPSSSKRLTAVIFRLTRSGLLDVMSQDYIRAARARGLIYVRDLDRLEIRCDVPQPLQ